MILCRICNKRVLLHSCHLICSHCNRFTHLNCLANVNQSVSIYTNRSFNKWICIQCIENIFPYNHIDDDSEFLKCIVDASPDINKLSLADLQSITFNAIELNDDLDIANCDPDLNYYNSYLNNTNCNYFVESTFNNKCKDMCIDTSSFSLVHLNIRSMQKNMSNFKVFLNNLSIQFTVTGLSETWINANNVDTCTPYGYNHECNYRQNRSGGGVSLLISNSIQYNLRSDLKLFNEYIETIFIEIDKSQCKSTKNIIIGTVYRPPNKDINVFLSGIKEILSILNKENKFIYIMGDFNINLLNIDKHLLSSEFIEMMYSFAYIPLIIKPTRIKKQSATLIDNIFSNFIDKDTGSLNGLLFTDISDHLPVFHINSLCKSASKKQDVFRKRIYSNQNIQTFNDTIQQINWNDVFNSNNAQNSFSIFYDLFVERFEKCFPMTVVRINYHNRKPWLSTGLKTSIKTKNKLYLKSIKFPSKNNINIYKQYRNKLHSILRKSEREYYSDLLKINKYNLAKSWKIIKDVLNKREISQLNNKFVINKNVVTDPEIIANSFNSFFVNIGSNLANKIPKIKKNPNDYIFNENPNSMFVFFYLSK